MSVPGATGPPEPLASPRQIGPFTLTAQIGAGRRTTAYIAEREDHEGLFVVRELRDHVDPEIFQAELMNARGLVVGEPASPLTRAGPASLAAAPLLIGESLATILNDAVAGSAPLNHDVALSVAMGIARQLDALGSGCVHGDLVPHHVIIGYDGQVHLIDPAGDAYRERAQAADRAGYRSPEHVRCDPLCPQSDVYVLGVLLFEMTTAHRLFGEPTAHDNDTRIVEGHLPRPRDIVGDGYPIELQLVLRKLLRPAAAGRFANGVAARDALRLVATTRREIGPRQVGSWLEARYPDRFATWQRLVGAAAMRPPPDRAATAVSQPRGGLDGVKMQIEALDAEAREIVQKRNTADRARLAEEIRAQRSRQQQAEVPSIPDEPTQQTRLPPPDQQTVEQPLADLMRERHATPTDTRPDEPPSKGLDELTEPLPRKHPKKRRPLRTIPDVPTEIIKKAAPRPDTIQDAPAGRLEAENSDQVTNLDEIELIQRSLDALPSIDPLPPLAQEPSPTPDEMSFDPLGLPTLPGDAGPLPDEGLGASEPPSLEVIDDADIEVSQDLPELEDQPPATEGTPAPDLSADLVLGPPTSDVGQSPIDLAADLLDPGEELAGEDTIQDQDAEAMLDDAILQQVKAHVLDEPKPWEEPPPFEEPIPLTERKPERSADTLVVRRPEARPNQADISTHVVRERIEPSDLPLEDLQLSAPPSLGGPPDPRPTPASLEAPAPAVPHPPPAPAPKTPPRQDTDLLPIAPQVEEPIPSHEDSSMGDLVIPVADDELARSRRSRWVAVSFIAGIPLLALAGGAVVLLGQEEQAVVALPSPVETGPAHARAGADKQDLLEAAPPVTPPDAGVDAPDAAAVPPPPPVARKRRPPPPPPVAPPPLERPPEPPPPKADPPPEPPPVKAPPKPPPPDEVPPEPPPVEAPPEPPPVETPPPEAPVPGVTQVRVRALPEEAVIVVNGEYELENGGLIEVGEEAIKIVAKAPGWEDKKVTIEPGRTKDVLLLLRKK